MKRIILTPLLIAVTFSSFAQSNFYKLAIGGGFGITQSYTEVKKNNVGTAGYGTLDYLFTPFISIGIEGQKGEINGGDFNASVLNRQFVNSYTAFSFNGRVSLGQFMGDGYEAASNLARGLYLGTGVGVISNKALYTTGLNPEDPNFVYITEAKSKDIYFPFNLGINFNFADREGFYRYALNFNYQANLTLGEGLDGYDDSKITFTSGNSDIYTFLSVGVKYNFGKMGLSRKTFRR